MIQSGICVHTIWRLRKGSGERTPTGRKRSAKFDFFFFFFFSWAGSHRKASSLKRRKGRRQQKTSHARRGMARLINVRMALVLRPNAVAAKENQLQAYVQDEAWPGANAKRRPIGRYTVELSVSTASVQQHRLIKEPAAQMPSSVQLKVVETTMGRKEQRERERKKAAELCVERARLFAKKAIVVRRWPDCVTRRRRVSGSSWKRTALRDRPASSKNKTKEALCSRLQRLQWVLNYSNFFSRWPAKCFSGIERFSKAESNCEISNYPSLWFSGINSHSFFFFFWFVCMSKVILSARFYFCLGFPAGRRTGSIALDRDEAKSTSSAGVLESLLNLFWWPFLPLFLCEKECLSEPGIRRLLRVVFFLLAVHLVATYGRKPISQPQKAHFQTSKVRFSRKNPLFTSNTFWSYAPEWETHS